MRTGRPAVPPSVRFSNQTNKTESCWLWTGAKDGDGYGQFTDGGGRNIRAHRFSWTVSFGPIPDGIKVLHKCDIPACVRPDHLFLGTDADNLDDAISKGRLKVKGEDNPAAKVSEDDVRRIRRSHESNKRWADRLGVCAGTIASIRRRKTWGHVP